MAASWPAFLIGIACLCWLVLIVSTQSALDKYLGQVEGTSVKFWRRVRHKQLRKKLVVATRPPVIYDNPKYIMFLPIETGQGIGNIMNGLLAAHLFGEEFGRIVCVSNHFKDFHQAFSPVHPQALRDCPTLPQMNPVQVPRIELYNFYTPPNECQLRDELASSTKVLFMIGNTYPRWPPVPDNFFVDYYRPKAELVELLPWQDPPHTVVHLRQADSALDPRKGLDPVSLQLLGQTLPRDTTFLVTNRVEWYDLFAKQYGWLHPSWEEVKHSALGISWGQRLGVDKLPAPPQQQQHQQTAIQMWCDWYTILMAKRVYHTHSDFSLSAIHWMNIHNAKTIQGVDEEHHTLLLTDESWKVDGESPPLVNRTQEQLRLCTVEQQKQEELDAFAKLFVEKQQRMARANGGADFARRNMGWVDSSIACATPVETVITLPNGVVQRQWKCPDVFSEVVSTS